MFVRDLKVMTKLCKFIYETGHYREFIWNIRKNFLMKLIYLII